MNSTISHSKQADLDNEIQHIRAQLAVEIARRQKCEEAVAGLRTQVGEMKNQSEVDRALKLKAVSKEILADGSLFTHSHKVILTVIGYADDPFSHVRCRLRKTTQNWVGASVWTIYEVAEELLDLLEYLARHQVGNVVERLKAVLLLLCEYLCAIFRFYSYQTPKGQWQPPGPDYWNHITLKTRVKYDNAAFNIIRAAKMTPQEISELFATLEFSTLKRYSIALCLDPIFLPRSVQFLRDVVSRATLEMLVHKVAGPKLPWELVDLIYLARLDADSIPHVPDITNTETSSIEHVLSQECGSPAPGQYDCGEDFTCNMSSHAVWSLDLRRYIYYHDYYSLLGDHDLDEHTEGERYLPCAHQPCSFHHEYDRVHPDGVPLQMPDLVGALERASADFW
ncbi:hypothetical protein EJ08DRAFT_645162 [Tothia fuscella]|uniref:Uncharacterized protein n=1 Tax=Tothia fuscella TaxID=1048955 RepID=A0A9P4P3C4_9PEZI|nr:hypothetical protein EJ08DRAFT_645162 [Tothia fuscella]